MPGSHRGGIGHINNCISVALSGRFAAARPFLAIVQRKKENPQRLAPCGLSEVFVELIAGLEPGPSSLPRTPRNCAKRKQSFKSLYLQRFAAVLFSQVHILHMVIVDRTVNLLAGMLYS
jgi:hypothetical protein